MKNPLCSAKSSSGTLAAASIGMMKPSLSVVRCACITCYALDVLYGGVLLSCTLSLQTQLVDIIVSIRESRDNLVEIPIQFTFVRQLVQRASGILLLTVTWQLLISQ